MLKTIQFAPSRIANLIVRPEGFPLRGEFIRSIRSIGLVAFACAGQFISSILCVGLVSLTLASKFLVSMLSIGMIVFSSLGISDIGTSAASPYSARLQKPTLSDQGVAIFADPFPPGRAPHILRMGDGLQVKRIHATWNSARVIQLHSLCNLTDVDQIRENMGQVYVLRRKEAIDRRIPGFVHVADPKPASRIGFGNGSLANSDLCRHGQLYELRRSLCNESTGYSVPRVKL